MAVRFRVNPSGINRVLRDFNARRRTLNDKKALAKVAAVIILNWIDRNFTAKGKKHENSSLHWKELSDATIAMSTRNRTKQDILQDTGRLKQAWIIHSFKTKAVVQSKVEYSGAHERGGLVQIRGRSARIPQRKILPTQKHAEKMIIPGIKRYLRQQGVI